MNGVKEFRWVFIFFTTTLEELRKSEEKFGNKNKNLDNVVSSSSLVECECVITYKMG